ncbi:hypothetical protein C8F01DRAFT_1337509 [Mycena amicta]|nr:hypothetical protein C8F01DRAFT_1090650 [Mycena amicta]KAJ7055260.1 hypothetical protein C8F01DRAFT_1320889 [Mycena amicta]KAJ7068848.1 hypothetical protein C8F01DRAFT_1337509 [Mycena amicta]
MRRRFPPPSLLVPPSPSDKRGSLYVFSEDSGQVFKIGRTNCPPRRKEEWARQCKPAAQQWMFHWRVPYAKKFEALVHAHFKYHGAWLRPSRCRHCRVKHREKFGAGLCGGRNEVIRVVEDYLGQLGWDVMRTDDP